MVWLVMADDLAQLFAGSRGVVRGCRGRRGGEAEPGGPGEG